MDRFFKGVCIATAILFLYLAADLFFGSASFVSGLGMDASVGSLVLSRRAAMFMLGFAVLTGSMCGLKPSPARRSVCATMATVFLGLSIMGTYEFTQDHVNSSIFVAVTIETLLWMSYVATAVADFLRGGAPYAAPATQGAEG